MNDTFSIKKGIQHCFHLQFLHSHFMSCLFPWTQASCALTFGSWIVNETPTFITLYNPFSKYFYRHQSFQQFQQTMQPVDFFDPALTNEEHRFLFKSSTHILRTVSLSISIIIITGLAQ
jgi:hypothetical protein